MVRNVQGPSCLQEDPKTAHGVLWFSVLTTSGFSDALLKYTGDQYARPTNTINIFTHI